MDHIAILAKNWLDKIISGEKTIESRWYKNKRTPYENISEGDAVYCKEVGKPVTVKCAVGKVLFFDTLNEEKMTDILEKYGRRIGLTVSDVDNLVGKKYCTLIFLKAIEEIEPFAINKTGFGLMSAWISVEDVEKIKR